MTNVSDDRKRTAVPEAQAVLRCGLLIGTRTSMMTKLLGRPDIDQRSNTEVPLPAGYRYSYYLGGGSAPYRAVDPAWLDLGVDGSVIARAKVREG